MNAREYASENNDPGPSGEGRFASGLPPTAGTELVAIDGRVDRSVIWFS